MPRQARAEQRVAALLSAAAETIAELGYEAATLTAIAARAGASIGSLYQYFPDKPAVARALAAQYGDEIGDRWAALAAEAASPDVTRLVERMFDVMLRFLEDRPAFLPLLSSVAHYQHDPAARHRLRGHIAALLRHQQPGLGQAEAVRIANVTVQIIKGMNLLFAGEAAAERQDLACEFRLALTAYLERRLRA